MDDLEDILNSPSPALDSTSADPRQLPAADWSARAVPAPDSNIPADAAHCVQGLSGASSNSTATCSESADPALTTQLPSLANKNATESKKASVWSTAYHSASAPLAAAWARIPDQLQNLPSLTVAEYIKLPRQCSPCLSVAYTVSSTLQAVHDTCKNHCTTRSQYLLDLMARNKAATAAATVAGAAAGGAVAGPFGIAAGMPLRKCTNAQVSFGKSQ